MEGRQKGLLQRGRIRTTAVLIILVLIVGAAGWILTDDKSQKAQKRTMEEQKMTGTAAQQENEGSRDMSANPLTLQEHSGIASAVERYYRKLGDETSFVEGYENLKVYTKLGKYQDTYVAFVRYDMRIRDVYTRVPGLGTVYVTGDGEGRYQVETDAADQEIQDFVETVAAHEDVQELFQKTKDSYQEAVRSDALLQEALLDLKEAYEDSTGS